MSKPINIRPLVFGSVVSLCVSVIVACVMHADFQARTYAQSALPQAQLAVFPADRTTVSFDIINERLMNLDGVAGVERISADQARTDVLAAHRGVQDILGPAENPFTAYFLVRPDVVSVRGMENLRNQIEGIDGVGEVRFDQNLSSAIERLSRLATLYRAALIAIGMTAAVALLIKLIMRWFDGKLPLRYFAVVTLAGIAAGAVGAAVAAMIFRHLGQDTLALMPPLWYVNVVCAALAATLLWEN